MVVYTRHAAPPYGWDESAEYYEDYYEEGFEPAPYQAPGATIG